MRPTNFPMNMRRWAATGHDNISQLLPVGEIAAFIAAAALNIGEFVYLSAAQTVNKSAVAAIVAATPIGVVVAGAASFPDYQIPEGLDTLLVGVPSLVAASAAGQEVHVQYSGFALMYCTGALANGGTVIPGAAAGQVVAGATAGQILGFNVGPALAGAGWALIKIQYK